MHRFMTGREHAGSAVVALPLLDYVIAVPVVVARESARLGVGVEEKRTEVIRVESELAVFAVEMITIVRGFATAGTACGTL